MQIKGKIHMVVFILINTFIIRFGTEHFDVLVPATVCICFAALIIHSFQIHRKLWHQDMLANREQAQI